VHASGCAPLLLYVLLYGLDTYASRQLGQTPASHARSTGVGLFVPKPSHDGGCQHFGMPDLGTTVRQRPLVAVSIVTDTWLLGLSRVSLAVRVGRLLSTLSSSRM
jgi:hypothetical protein